MTETMQEQAGATHEETWQAQTAAWELLALSFRYPDATLASAVATGEWTNAANEIAAALEVELPENWCPEPVAFMAGGDEEAVDVFMHRLRAEATRLFVGAPNPIVSPYEGVHRAAQEGVQALLFVNPHSVEVERFMKACGLGRPEGTNEPLDHIATECELMEYLSMLMAGAKTPEAAPGVDALPGGSAESAYREFRNEHIQTWVSGFAESVIAESRLPFYTAAAQLLGAISK